MQLFVIVFDMLRTATNFGAQLAASHQASLKLSAFTSTATAGVLSRILSLPAMMGSNLGKVVAYILGTLLVFIAAFARSHGSIASRRLYGKNTDPTHPPCADTHGTADGPIPASAGASEAPTRIKCDSEQSDEPAGFSDANHGLSSAGISEAPSRTEHDDDDIAPVTEIAADTIEAPDQAEYDDERPDDQAECPAVTSVVAFAGIPEPPVQAEYGDSDRESVAEYVAGTYEALARIDGGSEQSDEEQPAAEHEQMQEPIKRRRPTRRGKGKKNKSVHPVEQPADQPVDQPADQPVDQPVIEAPPKAPRKTRRAGRVITNKKLLGVLPTLSPQ